MALDIPIKNAEQQWAVWDSTRLNDFPFRDDDIIIGTWSKSGTTWMQQLVAQLVFQGDPEVYGQALSPWIEFRLLPKEEIFGIAEAQEHRRFIKTHSPLNCVPFLPQLKYIYAARDPKDVAWSMYHHHCITTPEAVDDYNNAPGRVGPPWVQPDCDVREYYLYFLENGYFPGLSPDAGYWPNIQSWWDGRQQPNVMLLHYNNMKSNFEDVAGNVAAFLEIEVPETIWPQIIEHCGIEYMREQAKKFEVLDHVFEGGGANFINKGINGRWKDVLSQEEIDRCDDVALENLGEECARWLKTGVET